ncbi:hypothetical protein ACFOEE_00710 [Pseudoalteromonas fenneropenaei]|uniref:DUF2633 family protein n=1 Tax=Pseudoalteromonas fenneropenaei TaxID=1737459 RepID=A0ABV7CEW4_9GAMM
MQSVLKNAVRALFLFSITLLALLIQAVFKALFNPSSNNKNQPMQSDIHYDHQENKVSSYSDNSGRFTKL